MDSTRERRVTAPRYRNELGKFSVFRNPDCVSCGKCVTTCIHHVHTRIAEGGPVIRPFEYRCMGTDCAEPGRTCVDTCPQKALSVTVNPCFETLGDFRWTPDLLRSNWAMAETGSRPPAYLKSETGASEGGFDKMRFVFTRSVPKDLRKEDISTGLSLNRRGDSRDKVKIDVPWYGGGMSFGSTNIHALLAKARAAKAWKR
jgi:ferredoxin